MSIQVNQNLVGLYSKKTWTAKKYLTAGGQGEIWLVADDRNQEYVLKWYHPNQSTTQQKAAIGALITEHRPKSPPWPIEAVKRFVWPIDLINPHGSGQFGYIMEKIDTKKYIEMGELHRRGKQLPFATLAEIGYQLAQSYRALHLAGLCYCDISKGNMLFDPNTGNVLICDNDNVGENGKVKSQILGTWEFMSPEIILGNATPSTQTDLHSLATLLFYLWMCHHPLHGNLECAIRSWDIPAKRRIYGEKPVFIFDPNDKSNRPDDLDYETVRKLWELCPQKIKDLFVKAFTEGLRNPDRRVTEGEWQRAFLQLKENNLQCPHCNIENNLWAQDARELLCRKCKKKISVPGYLAIGMNFHLALVAGVKLKSSHLNPEWSSDDILGAMVENPNNPGNWGIRNHTQDTWKITFADGEIKEVPPGRAAPLVDKLSFTIKGVQIKIISR